MRNHQQSFWTLSLQMACIYAEEKIVTLYNQYRAKIKDDPKPLSDAELLTMLHQYLTELVDRVMLRLRKRHIANVSTAGEENGDAETQSQRAIRTEGRSSGSATE